MASVLVIGAGVSGIAAARRLLQAGVKNVKILEARNRIGGRTWTIDCLGCPVDVGASWIEHATEENPLLHLARQHGSKLCSTGENHALFNSDGTRIDESVIQEAEGLYKKLLVNALERSDEMEDASLLDSLNSVGSQEERALMKGFDATSSNLSTDLYKAVFQYRLRHIESYNGGELGSLTTKNFFESDQLLNLNLPAEDPRSCEDDDAFYVADGYGKLVEKLAEGLDIELNRVVRSVDYSSEAGVRLTLTSGEVFEATYCICTIPLGVLKTSEVEFIPPLSKEKQQAIDRIGMGLLGKVILRFPYIFWDKELDGIGTPLVYSAPEWTLCLHKMTDTPILVTFLSPRVAELFETLTDDECVARVMSHLRALYGEDAPAPVFRYVSRWRQDPFCRGAYSFKSVGCELSDFEELGRPAGQNLFFAGEATTTTSMALVHGAYMSGLRAADQVIASHATTSR
eukprot:GILJ01007402.1.p1 GENE.GILJ01007402.1~~GILJ01007402.1.p1  ORF type:complete len:470 (-),score=46.35 GILJ01007402.1:215-1588(-)